MTSRRERLDRLAEGLNDHQPQPGWIEEAICPQTDPEIFFPEKGSSSRQALKVCASCPVKLDCLVEAMTTAAGSTGIWGGTTENDRRAIRRRLAGTPLGSTPSRTRKKDRDQTIVLLYRAGMSVPEVALEAGVSERTVHRAVAAADSQEVRSSCA